MLSVHIVCSVMATSPTQSTELLRELYYNKLHHLDFPELADYLLEKGAITAVEDSYVKQCEDREQQKEKICDILAAKGYSKFSHYRHHLRSFQTQWQSRQQDNVPLSGEASQRSAGAETKSSTGLHAEGEEEELTALLAREARKEGKRRRGSPPEVRGGGERGKGNVESGYI